MSRLLFSRLLWPVRRRHRARCRLNHRSQNFRSFSLTPRIHTIVPVCTPDHSAPAPAPSSISSPPTPPLHRLRAPPSLRRPPLDHLPRRHWQPLQNHRPRQHRRPSPNRPLRLRGRRVTCSRWTQIESDADIAAKDIITTNGIVIAICAIRTKTSLRK
jgi:hypothetical protein